MTICLTAGSLLTWYSNKILSIGMSSRAAAAIATTSNGVAIVPSGEAIVPSGEAFVPSGEAFGAVLMVSPLLFRPVSPLADAQRISGGWSASGVML